MRLTAALLADPDHLLTDAKLARRARICLAVSMVGFFAMILLLISTVRTPYAEHRSSSPSAIVLPPLSIAPIAPEGDRRP